MSDDHETAMFLVERVRYDSDREGMDPEVAEQMPNFAQKIGWVEAPVDNGHTIEDVVRMAYSQLGERPKQDRHRVSKVETQAFWDPD